MLSYPQRYLVVSPVLPTCPCFYCQRSFPQSFPASHEPVPSTHFPLPLVFTSSMNRPSKPKNASLRDPTMRRRAAQACATCRLRKVRCDAGIPKCALCVSLDCECVYLDQSAPRPDPNTRLLLDRIQQLEDRIFATSPTDAPAANQPIYQHSTNTLNTPAPRLPPSVRQLDDSDGILLGSVDPSEDSIQNDRMTLPVSHSGNANNVYYWNVVQSLLSESNGSVALDQSGVGGLNLPDTTDILLLSDTGEPAIEGTATWHIFEGDKMNDLNPSTYSIPGDYGDRLEHHCRDLVRNFFIDVHVFYPILSQADVFGILRQVTEFESYGQMHRSEIRISQYCLLLMVLCLGSLTRSGACLLYSNSRQIATNPLEIAPKSSSDEALEVFNNSLWAKAKLLLGMVSMENSIESAQCFALSR